jgi:hypothetical protein
MTEKEVKENCTDALQHPFRSALGGVYPPIEPMLQETQVSVLSLSDSANHVSSQSSIRDIKDAFRMVQQHLHEKHYLDRIVHALYFDPDDRFTASGKQPERAQRDEVGRNAFGKFALLKLAIGVQQRA